MLLTKNKLNIILNTIYLSVHNNRFKTYHLRHTGSCDYKCNTQNIIGNNPGSRNPHCRLLECRLQNAVWLNASKIKKWVFHEFNSSIVINKCLYRFLPLLFLFFITLMQSIPKKNAELRDDILPQIYYYFNTILIF